MRIQLGANLRRVRESTDVYFECVSQANPRLSEQIQWYFLREPTSLAGGPLKSQHPSSAGNIVNTSGGSISSAMHSAGASPVSSAGKQAAIERIFSRHVPSQSRASHATSLLFLDANSADTWINKQQLSAGRSGSFRSEDEEWLSLAASVNQNAITSPKTDQIDLRYFQLVTGGTNVIVADSSLVLQKVQRTQRGLYACSAANSRGRTYSKPIFLDVNCKFSILF